MNSRGSEVRIQVTLFVLIFSLMSMADVMPSTGLPPGVTDTQKDSDHPLPADETLELISVPEGFNVSLFASEPDVLQPIAMTFDDRGRLWIVECFSYPGTDFQGHDRILVFEDSDQDGRFDHRKVFADGGTNWTGIALGHGGVWITAAPELLFIPDVDRDDVPDAGPEVVLDGFTLMAGHNLVNGLLWGPDGWLYGRHGILSTSRPGVPGTAPDARPALNCGIWRVHPVTRQFEVVCHGTTNPWGMDYDQFGTFFFSNSVIEHLFQVHFGGRYKRMFGQDFDPDVYELMEAASDHFHWTGERWQDARGGDEHDGLGGGHAHSGAMIYLGDNWPAEYRGHFFTDNFHGNRIVMDRFERHGSGFRATHAPDFLQCRDPWFRIIDLDYGPDGSVYMIDWCDLGECHDYDGSHKSSGRIYRIAYGDPVKTDDLDLLTLKNEELTALLHHSNAWFARHARRILSERANDGQGKEIRNMIMKAIENTEDTLPSPLLSELVHTLRACDQLDTDFILSRLLAHTDERIRYNGFRWLTRTETDHQKICDSFLTVMKSGPSLMDLMGMASALVSSGIKPADALALQFLRQTPDSDHNLNVMVWMAIKDLVESGPAKSLEWLPQTESAKLRQWMTRRLSSRSR